MEYQKLVSIIVPVYKVDETLLRKSIESVLKQSYHNIELVLVDDGSPDKCGEICESYSEIDSRICVIHQENGGVSSARNRGLEVASGEYIFFVDSDDSLNTNAIDALFQIAKNTDADITICCCDCGIKRKRRNACNSNKIACQQVVGPVEAINNLAYNIHLFQGLEPTAVWGKLYKRRIVEDLRFNESMTLAEDFVFNYYAINKSKVIVYCNLKLYNYNVVGDSLTHTNVYSPQIIQSFSELIAFEKSQQLSGHSCQLAARCMNIAFTMYLKIPKDKVYERSRIEDYIEKNRKAVLNNRMVAGKIKIAILISYVSFDLLRSTFYGLHK